MFFPDQWNDLSSSQLVQVAEILHSGALLIDGKLQLLFALLEVKKSGYLKWVFSERVTDVQVCELLQLTDFILKENKLTKNIFPSIRIGLTRYHGPAEKLKNISFGEFIFADAMFIKYHDTKDEKYLDQLIAVLYRLIHPLYWINYDGDKRIRFNKYTIEPRAKRIARIKPGIKQAILLYYDGCRKRIVKENKYVFPEGNGGKKAGQHEMAKLLLELSGSKFGDLKQTEETRMGTILIHLNHLGEQREKRNDTGTVECLF